MTHSIAILGASGYTGAELVRLLHNHPEAEIVALGADSKAGQAMGTVYPHLAQLDLPDLIKVDAFDFSSLDFLFCFGKGLGSLETCSMSRCHFRLSSLVVYIAVRIRIISFLFVALAAAV